MERTMRKSQPSRRQVLVAGAATGTMIAAPVVLRAQTSTLRITTWGGKWGDIMKGKVLPAFEKEFQVRGAGRPGLPVPAEVAGEPQDRPHLRRTACQL
jgi:putative spermidine/putrescine transport system substrate-binding protein